MKTLSYAVTCFVFVVSAAAQTTTTPKPTPAQKTTAQKTTVQKTKITPTAPLTIPASAVKQPNGDFRYVDPKGTAWIYHNTPFGVSRATEAAVQANAAVPQTTPASRPANSDQDRDDKVTAVAHGDTIQFTRPTPFGATRWTKSKAALTSDEQKIWDREQAKRNQ